MFTRAERRVSPWCDARDPLHKYLIPRESYHFEGLALLLHRTRLTGPINNGTKSTGTQRCPKAQWGAEGAGGGKAHNLERKDGHMKKLVAAVLSVAVAVSLSPALSSAQSSSCPVEVTQAKDLLSKRQALVKPDDIQAPRSLAGARQDIQAPRGNQNVQAPRGNQDVQAPRGNQDVQAPRSLAGARQDIQAPRGNQDVQAPRGNQDVQAPRGNQNVQAPRGNQDVQAPRGNQNVQAPRGNQDVQAPRGNQDVQAPRTSTGTTTTAQAPQGDMTKKAASLVKQAEAACKSGNMKLASDKAKAALAILK